MRVFVTGGTGFIGGHLVRRLAHTGHEMTCLVRAASRGEALGRRGARIVVGDVTDPVALGRGMAGCDAVVHLANVYSFWEADPRVYERVNVRGTAQVMKAAFLTGVGKVVHLSTCEVFGYGADAPFTEETPVGPRRDSRYARSKFAGERIAWGWERRGLPLVVLYPGAVLGRGDTKPTGRYIRDLARGRIPFLVYPDTVLTVVHVRDVVEAIVQALEREAAGGRYLIGRHQLTIGALSRMVSEVAGVPLPRRRLPDRLVLPLAALLTGAARLTRRPPPWGLSLDQARVMRRGFRFDGSRATRELGISYTPIREAIAEMLHTASPPLTPLVLTP
jgi:dihydroflavonol-4-reductase